MARARSIKPGLYANEDLADCDVWARYIFPGLWMLADREGRLEDRPKRIKGALLPYDGQDVEPLLQELADRGFILRYSVGEQRLIQVLKFAKHQNPHHREAPSKLAPPPGWVPPKAQKPEADDTPQGDASSGHPEASLGLSDHEHDLARGESRADSLTPDTHDSLTPDLLSADQPSADSTGARASPRPVKQRKTGEGKTVAVWAAYSDAFRKRYGTEAICNAKVRGQLTHLVNAVGVDDAPKIAEFYLASGDKFYAERFHPVDLLLRDAQKLRTQWATGTGSSRHSGFDLKDYTAGTTRGANGALIPS